MIRASHCSAAMLLTFVLAGALESTAAAQPQPAAQRNAETPTPSKIPLIPLPRKHGEHWSRFSELPVWDDGLSEMAYYVATCVLYGRERTYTRVHLFNRQFLSPYTWVKTDSDAEHALPVFKFVISEEVPTDNYNYRFLITAFLERPALDPLKVSVSSQEWCGHTYKSLLWARFAEASPEEWSLFISSYSYFGDEGDRYWGETADVDSYETLFVIARAVAAAEGESRKMRLLRSMRSNRGADPHPRSATLKPTGTPKTVRVPLGEFRCRRVSLDWDGPETWFDVEIKPPHRLIAFRADDVTGRLRFVERRAYWSPDWPSKFHPVGEAP